MTNEAPTPEHVAAKAGQSCLAARASNDQRTVVSLLIRALALEELASELRQKAGRTAIPSNEPTAAETG